jgi:DNA-binding MarR family transcriptional regulator
VYQPVLRDVVATLEQDAGIDSGTYSVLAYLDRAESPMRLRELQELMRVRYSQPGLSRLVQRMERDKWWRR